MKPDEIKSMLNCCATSSCDCCPYYGADDYDECTGAMAETALDYIEQLERERDALVKTLHGRCFYCKNNKSSLCRECSANSLMKHWEWRGAKEDA